MTPGHPASEKVGSRVRSPARRPLVGAAVVLALGGLLVLGWDHAGEILRGLPDLVRGMGAWGPILFVAVYALSVVAFVPASALTVAGGAVFGVLHGTVYVFVAAVLGSGAAFLVARYLARGAIERRLQRTSRFAAVDRAVGEQGRKIVFLLRLSPVFPFNLLNYALGLTRVSFADYMLASFGMLPGTLLYVYSGDVAGEVAAAAAGATGRGGAETALLFVGLLATLVVTVLVTRIARKALQEVTDA